MAWPRRGTRKIVVDGEEFSWHYDAHCIACSEDVLTAGKQGAPYFLFIDPFPWGFGLSPKNVAAAISWARQSGWTAEAGPTRAMALNDATQSFQWLEQGKRHLGCLRETPQDL